MALGWDIAATRQLAGDLVRPAILFRLATDPVVRLWSGVGPLAIAADLTEDVDGAVYSGLGEFLPPPELNALVNGVAERPEFMLGGAAISGAVAELASSEASAIRAAALSIGFLIFDADQQQLSPTAWLWDGEADVLKVTRAPGEDGGATRQIILSAGSLFTGRKRPAISYFSDADQRRRSGDDTFCLQVRRYSKGSTKPWPI